MASARDAFQRQRAVNMGAASSACVSTSSTVAGRRNSKTISSGNECCSPSEMTMPLSVAAACSSKLNERQKRLRSASPQARLMRAPNGAWMHELHAAAFVEEALGHHAAASVGMAPSAALPGQHVAQRPAPRPAGRARNPAGSGSRLRRSPPAAPPLRAKAPRVRPGASPRQNGMAGAAPCASSTRTRPDSTRRMRQDVVPSRNTSPAMLSTAKSSSTRADRGAFRLRHHQVLRGIRNGAAGGDGGQARAAPAAHHAG